MHTTADTTLADLAVGTRATVVSYGGVSRPLRLAELGLRRGVSFRVLRVTAGGGRIVGIGGARVAMDFRTCRRLAVVPVPAVDRSPGTASAVAPTTVVRAS